MVKLREEQKAELIRQEKERRRIARLRQVRQQTATNAKVIRDVVSRKKTQVIEEIKSQIHEQVEDMMTEQERSEIENNLRARAPHSKRKTMTPRSKKRAARRREMTETDLALAEKRNADAMRRLRNQKKQEVEEREQRLAKRKEAAQKANAIMRGNQIL
ncbi:hypothetical protein CRE_17370 [Caenorhabditis remanei]|uniref:Uncharacterized protein n=1 Tax=Caenorhabditis remanei TaxID=31234 RepID=E3N1Y9_CAERE|nr:hypothetical protein CRE_17370 [Caenorhabditis remanei]